MLSPLFAAAQSSIDNVVSSLEKSKSVTNEVFSERRDPTTRAVIKSNRVFNFNNDKLAAKIMEAMRKERSKAVGFQMNTRKGLTLYTISFEDSKGLCSKYILMQQGQNEWIMSIEKTKYTAPGNRKGGKNDRSDLQMLDSLDLQLDYLLDDELFQALGGELKVLRGSLAPQLKRFSYVD